VSLVLGDLLLRGRFFLVDCGAKNVLDCLWCILLHKLHVHFVLFRAFIIFTVLRVFKSLSKLLSSVVLGDFCLKNKVYQRHIQIITIHAMLQSLHHLDKSLPQLNSLIIPRRHRVPLSVHDTFNHLEQRILTISERLDLFSGLGSLLGHTLVKSKLGVHLLKTTAPV